MIPASSITSGVGFARLNCRKTVLSWIIAIGAAAFAASYATSATSASLPSSAQASCRQHLHTSKGIEVSHKQAYGNKTDDKLEITPRELLNSAVFNWARVVSMFSLNGTELMYNQGGEEVIDLMDFYIKEAEKSLKEEWESALMSDGTGSGGRQMIGLNGAVPIVANTGTYGGIDRAAVPSWRTTSYNVTAGDVVGYNAWNSTTARSIMEVVSLARSRNSKFPDLWILDSNAYTPLSSAFIPAQRITTQRAANLGFESLGVWTPVGLVDVVVAGGIGNVFPANTIFALNTDSISIYEFPNQSFVPFHPGDGIRPINQDAWAQGIVWSGQFVVENPLHQVRIRTA